MLKKLSGYKSLLAVVGINASILAAPALGTRLINMAWNNRSADNPGYHMESFATGITGHVEFIRYNDGSMDVKEYPGIGRRIFDSELYQDLDGDGLVDRIRRNGAEWKFNKLNEVLVRNQDYETHQGRFDKADEQLQDLIDKYAVEN